MLYIGRRSIRQEHITECMMLAEIAQRGVVGSRNCSPELTQDRADVIGVTRVSLLKSCRKPNAHYGTPQSFPPGL